VFLLVGMTGAGNGWTGYPGSMLTQVEALIAAHGYWVVFVGTFLEGETVLVVGGMAAHQGLLHLPGVIGAACIGTLLGDQFFFWLGRQRGQAWVERSPVWRVRAERARRLALRGGPGFLLGFRFLYGLRSVTPLILGATGYPPGRFLVWNCLGAALWAVIVGVLGFALGQAAETVIGEFRRDSVRLLGVLLIVGACFWLIRRMWRPRRPEDSG
jgi:membrane protein DedA with SNARE-associated domain